MINFRKNFGLDPKNKKKLWHIFGEDFYFILFPLFIWKSYIKNKFRLVSSNVNRKLISQLKEKVRPFRFHKQLIGKVYQPNFESFHMCRLGDARDIASVVVVSGSTRKSLLLMVHSSNDYGLKKNILLKKKQITRNKLFLWSMFMLL